MRALLGVLAALLLLCGPAGARGSAVETWVDVDFEGAITKLLKARLNQETRINNSVGVYYYHTDLLVTWQPKVRFEQAGVGFRNEQVRKETGWAPRNALYAFGTVHGNIGDVRIENRSMIEYQFQIDQNGHARYRNRTMLLLPLSKQIDAPRLYLSDEIMFAFNRPHFRIYRNRVNLGLTGKLTDHLWGDVYLQNQVTRKFGGDEGEVRDTLEAVGFRLNLRF